MTRVTHPFGPLYSEQSRILILGSFPSVKSREQLFYYGHPQNRFWKVVASVFDVPTPKTVDEKRKMILDHGLALWDTIESCEITGSSDASINNVKTNDLSIILNNCSIEQIYCNGHKSYELYRKYIEPESGREAVCLPSKGRTGRTQPQGHLIKWEDDILPDKYDQNFFEYRGQPTKEEFAKAIEYQKKIGADFIKLEGREPLQDSFGLEESVTLTMLLRAKDRSWTMNPDLTFGTPSIEQIEELDVKHFGALYGEDFARRNVRRLYEKLTYSGAYLDGMLVGACYCFCKDGLICIDGLIVDEAYRKRYVATSLIAHVKSRFPLRSNVINGPSEPYLAICLPI